MNPRILLFILTITFFNQSCSTAQKTTNTNTDNWVTKQMPSAIAEHRELVSFPCDAFYPKDMIKNIDWLKKAFEKRDFKVKILEAPRVPIVLAERVIDSSLPTVLFYIHFDGQPVDKSKWDQEDPFIPVIKKQKKDGSWELVSYDDLSNWNKEWRIFARAAADDKGPIIMFLNALDILKQQKVKPAYNKRYCELMIKGFRSSTLKL